MKILHRIGAVVGGMLTGGIVVGLIEGLSSMVYRMPAGIDMNDHEALSKWISTLPVGAFLFVLTAWTIGCFAGTFVARRFAPGRTAIPALIVWAFFMVAVIYTLFAIPHPAWLYAASILACLLSGMLGLVLAAPTTYVVRCTRTIRAPIDKVFRTLATIDEFSKAVSHIIKVEFLTERRAGLGTRFRETRLMNGKEASTELEVTELVENEHVRLVSDAGGTIWDTVFRVRASGDAVEMDMQMDARPHRFFARIITPLILGMVSKFVEQDMDAVKKYCEA